VSVRLIHLEVLWVFGGLPLIAWSDRAKDAKDAEILIRRRQVALLQRQAKTPPRSRAA